ncbi:helix-turn-helix domain-containing protein, partial [Alteromonas stellipolaris]
DIAMLCSHMLHELPSKKRLHKSTIEVLSHYTYPGNIRELKNIVEQAYLLADENVIYPTDLPELVSEPIAQNNASIVTLEAAEAKYLEEVVAKHEGSIDSLAVALGVSQRTLYRKLQALGLKVK